MNPATAKLRAKREILELELGIIRIIIARSSPSNPQHAAALERERELRREIQSLKKQRSAKLPGNPSRDH